MADAAAPPVDADLPAAITSISFNQDGSRLAVCTTKGYAIYLTRESFKCAFENAASGTGIVEQLFATPLVGQVGLGGTPQGHPRCLRLINTNREKEIHNFNFSSDIRAVRMSRQHIVVVLDTTIHIYAIAELKARHVIGQTPANARGVCALAACNLSYAEAAAAPSSPCYLVYPGSETKGTINVFDITNLRHIVTLEAHTNPVVTMALSNTGSYLASVSSRGTIVRVFAVPSGEKLFDFRRGAYTSNISCMCFSADERFLAVSSDHRTVHVFQLRPVDVDTDAAPAPPPGWGAYIMSTISAVVPKGYLPNEPRCFAWATLPTPCAHSAVTLLHTGTAGEPYTLVTATSDNQIYKFTFDAVTGGECTLELAATLTRDVTADSDLSSSGVLA